MVFSTKYELGDTIYRINTNDNSISKFTIRGFIYAAPYGTLQRKAAAKGAYITEKYGEIALEPETGRYYSTEKDAKIALSKYILSTINKE